MKMKINILSLFTFLLLGSISAHANWKLENAFFYIESYKAVCTDCSSTKVEDNFPMFTPNFDLDVDNRYLMTGRIEINQINPDTYVTSKIIIRGIKLQMSAKGLIMDASIGGNSRMRIAMLKGKKINDIFASTFSGGKARVNALINLSMMVAGNDQRVLIVDNENLFSLFVSINVVMTKLKFSMDNATSETIIYSANGKNEKRVINDIKNLLSIKLN